MTGMTWPHHVIDGNDDRPTYLSAADDFGSGGDRHYRRLLHKPILFAMVSMLVG